MSLLPTLKKVDLEGNPTEAEDHLLEISAGAYIAFRDLLLRGEDKNLTIFEYKCYMVLLSAHEGGVPVLYTLLHGDIPELTVHDSVTSILKQTTTNQFFDAVNSFRELVSQGWVESAYVAVEKMAPLLPGSTEKKD
jgi:hypothetical protein